MWMCLGRVCVCVSVFVCDCICVQVCVGCEYKVYGCALLRIGSNHNFKAGKGPGNHVRC